MKKSYITLGMCNLIPLTSLDITTFFCDIIEISCKTIKIQLLSGELVTYQSKG